MPEEKNESVEETEDSTSMESPKEESTESKDDSLEDKLTRLERENKRLHRKVEKFESQTNEQSKKDSKKSDTEVLERLDKMALQVAGIKEADEVELFNKWKEQTSREADDIVNNSIFQKELGELRTAKANQAATSNVEGEKGTSGAQNTPEYWRAKATKGQDGKLLFSDDMPKEMYTKVADLIAKESGEFSEELRFHNS